MRYPWVACGIAAGILAGSQFLLLRRSEFTSTETLLLLPSNIPDRYFPALKSPDAAGWVALEKADIFSPERIKEWAKDLGLKGSARSADVERFRRNAKIEAQGTTVLVSFTAHDPLEAQATTAAITSELISGFMRGQNESIQEALRGKEERSAMAASRLHDAGDEAARKAYLESQEQLLNLKLVEIALYRSAGPSIQVLNVASRPGHPNLSSGVILGRCLLGGILLGITLQAILGRRHVKL